MIALPSLSKAGFPSASKLTVIDSGRIPSWSSLSSQSLCPSIEVWAGLWVLIILYSAGVVSVAALVSYSTEYPPLSSSEGIASSVTE